MIPTVPLPGTALRIARALGLLLLQLTRCESLGSA